MTIKVETRRFSWILVESRPITIEVGFLLESASYNDKVSESDDKVEFLQMIE
jgi:hypothetical protein